MKPVHFYEEVDIVIASVSDDGMHVEAHAGGRDAKPLPNGFHPLIATFRSEEEGKIRVAIEVVGATVEVPLEELERAIAVAREEVHAESFYPYPDDSDGAV